MDPYEFLTTTDADRRQWMSLVAGAAGELRHRERQELAVLILEPIMSAFGFKKG